MRKPFWLCSFISLRSLFCDRIVFQFFLIICFKKDKSKLLSVPLRRNTSLTSTCWAFHFEISPIFSLKKFLSLGTRKIYRIEFCSCSFRAIMRNEEPEGHESLIKCQAVETAKYLPSTTNCLSDIWYPQGHSSKLKYSKKWFNWIMKEARVFQQVFQCLRSFRDWSAKQGIC